MKTNLLQISAALAAILVAALLPINVTAAAIVAVASGLLAILCADYGRSLEPLRPDVPVSPFSPAESMRAELSEAA
jgi:hypothetical protein